MDSGNFFDKLVSIFTSVFADIETEIFAYFSKVFLGEIISGFLVIIIIFYSVRKMKEGEFKIPNDVYNLIAFLLMIVFVNYCLNDQSFMTKIVNYLQIPANYLANFVKNSRAFNLSGESIGQILNDMLIDIADRAYIFTGGNDISLFKLSIKSIVGFILWLVYACFGVILITSITMTFILTLMQIQFWKCFAVVMIPLIYFKATRGMTIFWLKTIIALSLISSFMIIIGHLSSSVEYGLVQTISSQEEANQSYGLLIAFIIAKIITITFLKEIPTMINGMLGTQASSGAGAFANSIAMGAVGAAGAGAGFMAFKGAMGLKGKLFGKGSGGGGDGASDGANSGGGGGLAQKGAKLIGNVTKGIGSTITTGLKNSNSSTAQTIGQGMSNMAQGVSNLSQGKAWGNKTPPKQ